MNEESRKSDRRVPPAVVDFAIEQLADLKAPPSVEDERAEFETWAKSKGRTCKRDGGGYAFSYTDNEWEAWQARAALTASAPNHSEQVRDRYTCTGKGGDYQLLGLAQGAGTLKGFNHMVYRNVDGVMFVREPEDFLSRMEKIAAAPSAAPAPGECVAVPVELHGEAERCAFVLENIGSMDAEDIDCDDIDLRFEDAEGRDTGCDVSIVEYAERGSKIIRALLAQQGKAVGDE